MYDSVVETVPERFRPVISAPPSTSSSCSPCVSRAASPEKMPARMAPAERMWRVTARVSMPLMPTMPAASRSSSRLRSERKFETTREGSRTTNPATQMRADSMSSSFMPVLPMCGAVIMTIWPAYDGSVRVSW